jgi:uncharacterized protein
MKKKLMLAGLLLLPFLIMAQAANYNVVFDLTSKDTTVQKSVVRWLTEISKAHPDATLEVVFYGQSLDMITKDKSVVSDAVTQLASNKNISFKVCEMAMARHQIDKSQLLPGVQTVPDGIYEIISKQREGYGYIKAGQ